MGKKGIFYYGKPRVYTGREISEGGHPWMSDEAFRQMWEESLTRTALGVVEARERLQRAEPGADMWFARRCRRAQLRLLRGRWLEFRMAVWRRDQGMHLLDYPGRWKRDVARWRPPAAAVIDRQPLARRQGNLVRQKMGRRGRRKARAFLFYKPVGWRGRLRLHAPCLHSRQRARAGVRPADGGAGPADGGAGPADGGATPADGGAALARIATEHRPFNPVLEVTEHYPFFFPIEQGYYTLDLAHGSWLLVASKKPPALGLPHEGALRVGPLARAHRRAQAWPRERPWLGSP